MYRTKKLYELPSLGSQNSETVFFLNNSNVGKQGQENNWNDHCNFKYPEHYSSRQFLEIWRLKALEEKPEIV